MQILFQVAKFAGALAQLNVGKGDRVVIYMPMVPQVYQIRILYLAEVCPIFFLRSFEQG